MKLTLALSKGRIFEETTAILSKIGIRPLEDPEKSRKLIIETSLDVSSFILGESVAVDGAGNVTFNAGLNTGAAGTLTKDGAGTLTLSGGAAIADTSAVTLSVVAGGVDGLINLWRRPKPAARALALRLLRLLKVLYLGPQRQQRLSGQRRTIRTLERITAREIDVIRGICQEKTCREIAHDLQISPRTVETHKMRIIEKLDVRNTAGIIVHAVRLGIIP